MQKIKSKTRWGIACGLLAVVVCLLYVFLTMHNRVFDSEREIISIEKKSPNVFVGIRESLPRLLKEGKVEGTIKVIDGAFAQGKIPLDKCHSLLHLVGHQAYSEFSGDFSYLARHESAKCVASFQHGIEAQIVETVLDPKEVVRQLTDYCTAIQVVYPGITCFHGAGHGAMRLSLNATSSLELCDALYDASKVDQTDCYRGIFSEYGNQVLGYDGDTGEQLVIKSSLTVDPLKPLATCDTFAEKYRKSCYSQLTKIVFVSNNPNQSIKNCLNGSYTYNAQLECTRIVGALVAEHDLYASPTVKVPESFFKLPSDIRKGYITGSRLAFLSYKASGVIKDWKTMCGSFGQDERYCLNTFSDFQSR